MIALGSDHGGLALKRHVMEYLDARGLEYQDFGCYTAESCDYPDFGRAAAEVTLTAGSSSDSANGVAKLNSRHTHSITHNHFLTERALI